MHNPSFLRVILRSLFLCTGIVLGVLLSYAVMSSKKEFEPQWLLYIQEGQSTSAQQDRADEILQELEIKMETALRGLGSGMDDQRRALLMNSQRAWWNYAEAQASLVADHWRGGSGASVLYAITFAELMEDRRREVSK